MEDALASAAPVAGETQAVYREGAGAAATTPLRSAASKVMALRPRVRPRSAQPRLGAGQRRHGSVDDARGVMDGRAEPQSAHPRAAGEPRMTISLVRRALEIVSSI
jgi:hypothetical protein